MTRPPHRRYFHRNRGEWDWRVHLEGHGLASAPIPLAGRLRLRSMFVTEALFGDFDLWTRVDYDDDADVVGHLTVLEKWGMTFFRSEEQMILGEDGSSLEIRGQQYWWPRLAKARPLGPFPGRVLDCSTRAEYRMDVLGLACDFRSQLDGVEGVMKIEGEHLRGSFTLSDACIRRIARRRDESTSAALSSG